jgi:hypothetical protein
MKKYGCTKRGWMSWTAKQAASVSGVWTIDLQIFDVTDPFQLE